MDSYKERKYAQNPNLLYLQYVEENSTLQTEMRISIVSILCEIHPKKRKHTHTYTDKRRIKILTVINSRLKPESIAIKKIQLCVRYARTRTHKGWPWRARGFSSNVSTPRTAEENGTL